MKKDLLKNSNKKAAVFTANALIICTFMMIIMDVLNTAGVFILDKTSFNIVTLICGVIMCVPKLIMIIRGRYEDWMRYIIIASIVIAVGVAYAVLTFHMVMAFTLPLLISMMFFDKKLTVFTSAATAVSMIISHIVSVYTSVVFDDPLVTMKQVMIFGLLPRLAMFAVISIICIVIGVKADNIFNKFIEYNTESDMRNQSLDTIISVSRTLYTVNDLAELTEMIRQAVSNAVSAMLGYSCTPETSAGIFCENGTLKRISGDARGKDIFHGSVVESIVGDVSFSYPVKKEPMQEFIKIQKNSVGMCFYNDEKLVLYVSAVFPPSDDTDQMKKPMRIFYNNISTAINRTMLNENMFRAQESVILSLAEISESKSHQTGQHVKRVSEYTKVMASFAGYGESKCSEIALAAMMHDIGKLMIPPEILEKPGKLTKEEFDVIKTHVTYGEELLKNSPGEVMSMARRIALQHHERWDGNGYLGYRGEEIDFLARIVAVADVFDALVSKRSYKDGWAPADAYAEIVSQKGKQFAPHAVDVFIESYDKILEILKRYPDEITQPV